MIVNKKALYALANYYEACNLNMCATPKERKQLADLFIPCVQESFNEKEIYRNFGHMEIFFKFRIALDYTPAYTQHVDDMCIAKLLRYIAKHSKFPPLKRLHYV